MATFGTSNRDRDLPPTADTERYNLPMLGMVDMIRDIISAETTEALRGTGATQPPAES